MTCKEYSQWESAVEYIRTNSPISEHVEHYKDYSRIMALIKNNTNLFNITTDTISINPTFDNYFYNNFMLKYDIEELNEILYRDVDYSYFLYNVQDFDINLIDRWKYFHNLINHFHNSLYIHIFFYIRTIIHVQTILPVLDNRYCRDIH